MAIDRFVYWPVDREHLPKWEAVVDVVMGYCGPAARGVTRRYGTGGGSLILSFGIMSFAYRGVAAFSLAQAAFDGENVPLARERVIEVWDHADKVDVITRGQDAFTNDVAEGLANVLCRAFGGLRE